MEHTVANLVVDLNVLTINDLIEFESLAGITFDQFTKSIEPNAPDLPMADMLRVYRAFSYLNGRRQNPGMTIEDAGDVPVGGLKVELRGETPDPTGGGEQNNED